MIHYEILGKDKKWKTASRNEAVSLVKASLIYTTYDIAGLTNIRPFEKIVYRKVTLV